MKFNDGYWNVREGYSVSSPAEARDARIGPDSLTVFAPCRPILRRSDTLNLPLLSFEYDSPAPDVIRVRIVHFKGRKRPGPEFPLFRDESVRPVAAENEEEYSLTSGALRVSIARKNGWAVEWSYRGRRLTGSGPKDSGYAVDADKNAFMREQLDLDVGECVYGLGERFTAFVKNGQVVDMWNEDGGTSSEQAYKNVPFFLTNRGFGVFVRHPEKVSFELASECVSKIQFSVPGECLEYCLIGGDSPKDVLKKYTGLTGRPALPPAWSFGLWLTTSFTTSYDERTVNGFIDGMAARGLPLHVFHFDCFWMKEFQWCDFQWDMRTFPDPPAMLKRLKERGLKICVWINPYIAQKSRLFEEGMAGGFLVKTADGGVWQWDRWQPGMGLVDFTNPQAAAWFKGELKRLVEMGVDCFKTDFGERIPVDVVYHDGSDPLKMHNFYTYLYNQAVFEVLAETRGRSEALLFARSATAGSQQFPVHWGGDCSATFASMAESLRGGLSLGLSGFGFWSHDISGFEKTASPEIYKRWSAFGLLSSHSRLHGNESYRVPWLFDEEAVEVLRFFTRLKCRLMPYLYAAACQAAREGAPLMRAMLLEFPDDPACDCLDRQYMLGDSLLVAPVFKAGGQVDYYLPAGKWTGFLTDESVEGGSWRRERHGFLSLPLLVRPNSLIAVGREETRPDYDFTDGVVLHAFQPAAGPGCSAEVFNAKGVRELAVSALRTGNELVVEYGGAGKPWSLLLRGQPSVESVQGGGWEARPEGTLIVPAKAAGRMTIRF